MSTSVLFINIFELPTFQTQVHNMLIHIIHSSADGHLESFHVLSIVNIASVNIVVHVSFRIVFFSGYMPSSGLAGSSYFNVVNI
jgi:hypothetical protein